MTATAVGRPPPGAFVVSGWVPAGLAFGVVVALLVGSGVSVRDTAAFSAYAAALTAAGVLLWRAAWGGRPRYFATDVAAGFVVGCAVELPVYLAALAAGVPDAAWLWAPSVLVVCAVVPRARPYWRGRGTVSMSCGAAWAMTLIVLLALGWVVLQVWVGLGVSSGIDRTYSDEQYALALVGELRHHLPPQVPWVAGEPLQYHWYGFAHVAATSWATGIEPVVLLRRLSLLPAVAITVVCAVEATRLLTRRPWTPPLAALLLVAVGATSTTPVVEALPYGQLFLDVGLWLSPTQTLGAAGFGVVLVLVLRVLDERQPGAAPLWILLVAAVGVLAGTKSTFLPVALAGSVGVVVLSLLVRQRVAGRQLALCACLAGWLVTTQVLVFRGATAGVGLRPFDAGSQALRALSPATDLASPIAPAALVCTVVLVLFIKHVGLIGLVTGGGWRDPRSQFLLAATAAGVGAYILLGHQALSQAAFAKAAALTAAVATAAGLERLLDPVRARRARVALAASCALGLPIAWLFGPGGPRSAVIARDTSWVDLVARPVLVLVCVIAAALSATTVLLRGRPSARILLLAAAVAPIGAGLVLIGSAVEPPPAAIAERPVSIAAGGIEAARWVRHHSSPDDLMATNAHRYRPPDGNPAATEGSVREFWLAAFAERRVLVQGWGYTERINSAYRTNGEGMLAPFWDQEKLMVNDRVFTAPSAAAVDELSGRYGVRWLILDDRLPNQADRLAAISERRFRSGHFQVFEVVPEQDGAAQ